MIRKCSTKSLKSLNLPHMCVRDLYAYIRAFGPLNVYKQIIRTKPYIKKANLITLAKKVERPSNNNKSNNSNEYKAFMNDLIKAVLNKKININEVGAIRAELRTQKDKARFNQALSKAFTTNIRRSQRTKKSTRRNNFVY